MRYPRSQAEHALAEGRRRLLDAAAKEIAHKGLDSANINDISLAAGFAKGTVYNYFPSKRALMESLLEAIAADHCAFITERVLKETAAEARLARFFDAGFDFALERGPQARVATATANGSDLALKAALYRAYQPLYQFVATEIVAYGVAQGVFRSLDTAAVTNLLMTLYLGSVSQVDEEGHPWLAAGDVADFAWHALRTQP